MCMHVYMHVLIYIYIYMYIYIYGWRKLTQYINMKEIYRLPGSRKIPSVAYALPQPFPSLPN